MNSYSKTCKLNTVGFNGINVYRVDVEIQLIPGVPKFKIVGLGDKAISESQHRISCALYSLNIKLPAAQVIVNLSPADIEKYGTHYDLPIALGIVSILKNINIPENAIIAGELGLDGTLRAVKGILPICSYTYGNNSILITSQLHHREIAMVGNKKNIVGTTLHDLIDNITNRKFVNWKYTSPINNYNKLSFDHIYGQNFAKRALMIAIAGKHHFMMVGSHGVGKSTLAKLASDMAPILTKEESIETTSIYNMYQPVDDLMERPPFREPHSSSSKVAIIGGGPTPKPGEVSLAHNGILFLDELPEFTVIDTLRTPIEDGYVNISRSKYNVNLPARFQLITSMNPCKCGLLKQEGCLCRNNKYLDKISQPIRDRIDISITLMKSSLDTENTFNNNIHDKILNAIDIQRKRGLYNGFRKNVSNMINAKLHKYLYEEIVPKLNISMRKAEKIINIAQTICDLEQETNIKEEHLLEALMMNNGNKSVNI